MLAELATVRHDLSVVNGQVSAYTTALAQDTTQLKGVQAALANAQSDVSHQTSTIADLHTCLGGVEQALNALAVSDQNRAVGHVGCGRHQLHECGGLQWLRLDGDGRSEPLWWSSLRVSWPLRC